MTRKNWLRKKGIVIASIPEIMRLHCVTYAQSHRTQMVILGHRLQELGFASYASYLRSPHWVSFRARWYRRMGKPPCSRCHKPAALELHHRTYNRLGYERVSDVVGLCRSCHAKTHTFSKAKRSHSLQTAHRASRSISVRKLPPRRLGNLTATRGPWQNPRTVTSHSTEAGPCSSRIAHPSMSPEGRSDTGEAPLRQHVHELCPKPLSPASAPAA